MEHYFDNGLLAQYLQTGSRVQVFVMGGYYDINSVSDLQNPVKFVAYDVNGSPSEFKYMEIEHLLINGQVVDMDTLEKGFEDSVDMEDEEEMEDIDDEDMDDDEEGEDLGEPPTDDEGGDDMDFGFGDDEGGDDEEPGISDSYRPGQFVQNIDQHSPYYGRQGLVVLSEENGYVRYKMYCPNERRMISRTIHKKYLRRV